MRRQMLAGKPWETEIESHKINKRISYARKADDVGDSSTQFCVRHGLEEGWSSQRHLAGAGAVPYKNMDWLPL